MEDKYCLQWNNHHENIAEACCDLRKDGDFYDVTLSVGDRQVEAHKVVLSACSPLFKRILKQNSQHHHPLIYLHKVGYEQLLHIIDFMYYGSVSVSQQHLNEFLALAEELQIKGLAEKESKRSAKSPYSNAQDGGAPPPPAKKPRPSAMPPVKMYDQYDQAKFDEAEDVELWEEVEQNVKMEAELGAVSGQAHYDDDGNEAPWDDNGYAEEDGQEFGGYDDYDEVKTVDQSGPVKQEIADDPAGSDVDLSNYVQFVNDSDVYPPESGFKCSICPHVTDRRSNCLRHVKTKHFPHLVKLKTCKKCRKKFTSKEACKRHYEKCAGVLES